MSLVEQKPKAPDTFVLRRGDYRNKGPKVMPRPPGVILASQRSPAFATGKVMPKADQTVPPSTPTVPGAAAAPPPGSWGPPFGDRLLYTLNNLRACFLKLKRMQRFLGVSGPGLPKKLKEEIQGFGETGNAHGTQEHR